MKRTLFVLLIVLILIGMGTMAKVFVFDKEEPKNLIYGLYPGDSMMWEHIFENKGEIAFEKAPKGVILPHHIIAADKINAFYKGLSEVMDPSVVAIIGPNHYEAGPDDIQICRNCVFETSEGELETDQVTMENLVLSGNATVFDEAFLEEHSIYSHAPFIKKYFPEAKILPIILKYDTDEEKLLQLADWLYKYLPDDALLVASVDFSHYQPPEVADFHDLTSETSIRNFNYENFWNLEIDSPASVYTLLKVMEQKGVFDGALLADSNSQDYLKEHQEETTSHQFWGFFDGGIGEIGEWPGVSILSFGNIDDSGFLDENDLGFYRSWKWDPDYDESSDNSIMKTLRDIRGEEDRFFAGSDFYVFDLDEGCVSEEKNGMQVGFCKFSEKDGDLSEQLEIIDDADENNDLVYLLYDYAGSELTDVRKDDVRSFINNGVDVFVGRGIKQVIPFEIYKGSLVFYSLGDFIGNSRLALELSAEFEGVVLGLYVTEDYYYIYTFSVDVNNGYPVLKDFSERPAFFLNFISAAKLGNSAETDSLKGVVKIKR